MPRAAKGSTALALAVLLSISACGREASLRTAVPPSGPGAGTDVTQEQFAVTRADTPPTETNARGGEDRIVTISDTLTLERLPDSFEPLVAAEQFVGRFGERVAMQRFVSWARRGSVIIWITHGRPAADLLVAPRYAPSVLSSPGLTLFEYQNQTTLTSNALAWSIAPDVVVGVTSREIDRVDLLEWIPLVHAHP